MLYSKVRIYRYPMGAFSLLVQEDPNLFWPFERHILGPMQISPAEISFQNKAVELIYTELFRSPAVDRRNIFFRPNGINLYPKAESDAEAVKNLLISISKKIFGDDVKVIDEVN